VTKRDFDLSVLLGSLTGTLPKKPDAYSQNPKGVPRHFTGERHKSDKSFFAAALMQQVAAKRLNF